MMKHDAHIAPRLVAWETTRRCPMNCLHCRGAARDIPYENELSTDEARLLIDNIASFSAPIFILTGGEPMYRHDIYEIARYATSAGLRVVMSPCGQLIDDVAARRIIDAGIQRLSISIDGADAKTHDAFRGTPGAFEKTMRGLAILRDNGIPFQINSTITTHNSHQLDALILLARNLGAVGFHPFFLVPTGRGAALADRELSADEYEAALTHIARAARDEPIEIQPTCAPHFYRIMRQSGFFKSDDPRWRKLFHSRGCLGGQGFAFISYCGDVQPCGFFDRSCGNLRDVEFDFKTLYQNAPLFLELRNRAGYHGKCGRCEFSQVCGGCRARTLSITGDHLGSEPYCRYEPKKHHNSLEGASASQAHEAR